MEFMLTHRYVKSLKVGCTSFEGPYDFSVTQLEVLI